MPKLRIDHFVTLLCCLFFVLSLLGCAAPQGPLGWGFLPSRAEVEADRKRLAIPPKLRAQLKAIAAESCKTAENTRPDPRHIGQTYRLPVEDVQRKLLEAVLMWSIAPKPEPESPGVLPPTELRAPVSEGEAQSTLEHPIVQFSGGFAGGLSIGAVPLGPIGAEVAIELRILPQGTYWARVGKACGEIVVGTGQIALGCFGVGAGVGMSGTGGGAAVGVPIMVGSLPILANGCVTAGHGLSELWRAGDAPESSPAPSSSVVKPEPTPKPAAQQPPAAKPASTPSTGQTPAQVPKVRPGGKKSGKNTTTWVKCTGQWHHAISKTIHKKLQDHDTLKNVYKNRDPRFQTQAIDKKAHNGYETWHRAMEKQVEAWLDRYDKATPAEFEAYLRDLYKTDKAINWRFPNGF